MEEKITLHDKTFKPYIPYEEIEKAIARVPARLNADYALSPDVPAVLCVLNGAILFTAEMLKRLTFPIELLSMKLSSYEGTASTGEVREIMGLSGSVAGKRVLIMEDIVDTENTIENLIGTLKAKGATEVKICAMLLKPEVYHKDIPLDYVAMEIPNRFIVGFGLDYDELGRNYKDIYVIDNQ